MHSSSRHTSKSLREDNEYDDDNPPASLESEEKNKGTLIVDATCAPEDMRFPNDVSLLDEARRKTEKIIDALHEKAPAGYAKPRTYRTRARKEFLLFIRNRKPRETTIRNAIRKQLLYVERNLRIISDYREKVGCIRLTRKQYRDLVVISELARQQRELYRRKSHSVRYMEGIRKSCVQTKSIGHGRTCGTVRKREFVFPGRSWGDHFRNEKGTERDFGNSEGQNGRMSARRLRLKASLGKASGGIHWIG
jgi:hypothetical protein